MTCPHGTPDDRVPSVVICRAERGKSGARQEWAAANGGFILTTWWCRWRCPVGRNRFDEREHTGN